MWVVSVKRLREFWKLHANAKVPLRGWHTQTQAADWRKFSDVRAMFPSADLVGNCTVFNIVGNKYRLVARVFYPKHKVYVLRVMTHAEYDKDEWPEECDCHSKPPERARSAASRRRKSPTERGGKSDHSEAS